MKSMFNKIALAAFALAATITMAVAEPVYVIAQIQIENREDYMGKYGSAVFPMLMKNGAKVLVATPSVDTLEGEWKGNWTVVIEFGSEEIAKSDWYNSDAYKKVRELRYASTSLNNMVIAPAFVPPSQ